MVILEDQHGDGDSKPMITANRFRRTPLGWALYAWGSSPDRTGRQGYYDVVALLARAGAKWDPQWYEDDVDRQRAAMKMRSDPRMLAALNGKMPGT